jgi:hypothetical protein
MPLSTRRAVRRTVTRAIITLAAVATLTATVPAAAQAAAAHPAARPAPAAGLAFRNSAIPEGSAPQIIYAVRNAGRHSAVYLQDRTQSFRTWQTVERVSSAATFTTAPDQAAGQYAYRLRIVREHRTVAISRPALLTVTAASQGQDCGFLCQFAKEAAPYVIGGILALFGIPS